MTDPIALIIIRWTVLQPNGTGGHRGDISPFKVEFQATAHFAYPAAPALAVLTMLKVHNPGKAVKDRFCKTEFKKAILITADLRN